MQADLFLEKLLRGKTLLDYRRHKSAVSPPFIMIHSGFRFLQLVPILVNYA